MLENSAAHRGLASESSFIHEESYSLSVAKKRYGVGVFSLMNDSSLTCPKIDQGYSIAAVLHNNVKEIGVAFLEFPSFALSITQFGDTCSYSKLNTLLFVRNPVEVLLSSTTVDDPFTRTLTQSFGDDITFISIPRKYFDVEGGVARLNSLKSSPEVSLSIEDTDLYLSVASANALVLYVESITHTQLLHGSIRVRCIELDHFVHLSRSTARSLHILPPSSSEGTNAMTLQYPRHTATTTSGAQVCPEANLKLGTLINALPRPRTAMGRRFLRSSLLQPLKDRASIQHRQDAVEWLIGERKGLGTLSQRLYAFADIDLEKITSIIAHEPLKPTNESHRRLLVSLLDLWDGLDALQSLRVCLQSFLIIPKDIKDPSTTELSTTQPFLLQKILQALDVSLLDQMLTIFDRFLDPSVREPHKQSKTRPDTTFGYPLSGFWDEDKKSKTHRHRVDRQDSVSQIILQLMRISFAFRAAPGSALDTSRSALCEQIHRITDYRAQLALQYQMSTLKLEAEPDHMFCLSYSSFENNKTAGGPFIYKYAGSSHYQLYLEALYDSKNERPRDASLYSCKEITTDPHLNPFPRPSEACHRKRKSVRVYCTTSELKTLCQTANNYSRDIFLKQVQAAGELLVLLRGFLGRIQVLTEAVALVDMLLSFSTYSLLNRACRPVFLPQQNEVGAKASHTYPGKNTQGANISDGQVALSISNAYYPSVVSHLPLGSASLVPNTVTWEEGVSVVILTGPNGAGKTLLLRMIGQIFVLAQCGCFVPAQSAKLFITDRILAHMLCDEPPSIACSSQRRELIELSDISNVATSRSIVLIDELGRSMLHTEGFTLASAAVMWLRSKGIRSIFSTHFSGITEFPSAFSDVINMHFALVRTEKDVNKVTHRTIFSTSHHLKPGACPDNAYGLEVAANLGLPAEILAVAYCLYRITVEESKKLVIANFSAKP